MSEFNPRFQQQGGIPFRERRREREPEYAPAPAIPELRPPGAPPYTWREMEEEEEYQKAPRDLRDKVRRQYFDEYISPSGQSWDEFKSSTEPSFLEELSGGVSGAVSGAASTLGLAAEAVGMPDTAKNLRGFSREQARKAQKTAIQLPYKQEGWEQLQNVPTKEFWEKMFTEYLPQSALPIAAGTVGFIGGGKLGAAAGSLAGPVGAGIGGAAGAILGAALGLFGATMLQSAGPAYDEYLAKNPGEEDLAVDYALKKAGLMGLFESAAAPLGLLGYGLGPVKHAFVQMAVQMTHGGGSAVVENALSREVDPERPLSRGVIEEMFAEGLFEAPMITAAVRRGYAAAKKQVKPGASTGIDASAILGAEEAEAGFPNAPNPEPPDRLRIAPPPVRLALPAPEGVLQYGEQPRPGEAVQQPPPAAQEEQRALPQLPPQNLLPYDVSVPEAPEARLALEEPRRSSVGRQIAGETPSEVIQQGEFGYRAPEQPLFEGERIYLPAEPSPEYSGVQPEAPIEETVPEAAVTPAEAAPVESVTMQLDPDEVGEYAVGEEIEFNHPETGADSDGIIESISPEGEVVIRIQPPAEAPETPAPRVIPAVLRGNSGTVETSAGTRVEFEYAVVEAADLETSHDERGTRNPSYPDDLQPRQRDRGASKLQITRIGANPKPELLGANPLASDGAPIIGPDFAVESGNGRVAGLRIAYKNDRAGEYRAALIADATSYGVPSEDIQEMEQPVLVRMRTSEMTPEERNVFTSEANEASLASMSATEQAIQDAKKLENLDLLKPPESGQITVANNREFIRHFLENIVPANEQGTLMDPDGDLSQDGMRRIRNAVFVRAYGESPVILRMMESADNNVRNITNGMLIAAPKMAKVGDRIQAGKFYPLDITEPLAVAVEEYSSLREKGLTIGDVLSQEDMLGDRYDDLTKDLIGDFQKWGRSAKRIGEFLNEYADAVEALGSPKQEDLLSGQPQPTIKETLAVARKRTIKAAGEDTPLLDLGHDVSGDKGTGKPPREQRSAPRNIPKSSRSSESEGKAPARPHFGLKDFTEFYGPTLLDRAAQVVGNNPLQVKFIRELNEGVVGDYDRGVIRLSYYMFLEDKGAITDTFDHELFHYMMDRLLSKGDRNLILNAYRKGSPASNHIEVWAGLSYFEDSYNNPEERAAFAFSEFASKKYRPGGVVEKVFTRLLEIIRKLWSVFHGLGYRTANDVFREIDAGKLAAGQAQTETPPSAKPRQARVKVHPNPHTKDQRTFWRSVHDLKEKGFIPTQAAYKFVYDRLGERIPDRIKAGILDRWGQTEEMGEGRHRMHGGMRRNIRIVGRHIEKMMLNDVESSIAYEWLQTRPNTRREADLMAQLPEESRENLHDIRRLIHQLGQEMVRMGQVSRESFKRNEFIYLHRMYRAYELDEKGELTKQRQKAKQILGETLKGRGMFAKPYESRRLHEDASPEWRAKHMGKKFFAVKGKMFLRYERRDRNGKLNRVAYVQQGHPIPAIYSESQWLQDAENGRTNLWEARYISQKKETTFWRDLTRAEREKYGEITEAKYAVTRTLLAMTRNVEFGRYFEWIRDHKGKGGAPDWALNSEEDLPEGHVLKGEGRDRGAYLPTEWVRVPEATIPKTGGVKKYGAISGKLVPGPLWTDIAHIANWDQKIFGEWFQTMLRIFKISKTALTPGVHLNNVMANVWLADWADLGSKHVLQSMGVYLKAWRKDPAALIILERFEGAGASFGTYAAQELKKDILEPLEAKLRQELKEKANDTHPLSLARAMALKEVLIAGIKKPVGVAVDIYQLEDNVFRLAMFMKGLDEGLSDIKSGRQAIDAFLDYDIAAPWVDIARKTGLPFISFTYRALPKIFGKDGILAKKQWKVMKLALVGGALNALGYALSEGDEEAERALLPERKQGRVFGLFPRLLRMPWNWDGAHPVFLDVTRWIPMGDMALLDERDSVVPIPPFLNPGGPLAWMGEVIFNKDLYTGDPIRNPAHTVTRQVNDSMLHFYRGVVPNFVLMPRSYNWDLVGMPGSDRFKVDPFGREYPGILAWANTFGIKLASYPQDNLQLSYMKRTDRKINDLEREMWQAGNSYLRKGIDKKEFESKMTENAERIREVVLEAREKLTLARRKKPS